MKNVKSLLKQSIIILSIATMGLLPSCDKKENEGKACLAIFAAPQLRFNVISSANETDLFFSSRPIYITDDMTYTIGDATNKLKPRVETSETLGKHFVISNAVGSSGTIKLYIADQLKFTIDYTIKKQNNSGCAADIYDKITINTTQKEENVDGRVVKLKL